MTAGVRSLSDDIQSWIVEAVQRFMGFTADNDPHGEHDFGVVTINRYKVFWKIDYYDLNMEYASDDPANPAVTKRVLTIMLAEEY